MGSFSTSVTETELLTVFVNERPLRVQPGTTALGAVRLFDPALAQGIASGRGFLTDGRGIRLAHEDPLTGGAIIRAAISARQSREGA